MDHTDLPVTHTFIYEQNEPAFTLQPQGIIVLWTVLISHTAEGRKLS